MPDVTLRELAAALIAPSEGKRLTAYQDSGKIWTIGIGHTKDVHAGQVITDEEADRLFAADQAPLFALVAGLPILEAAALVSFGFNCGDGALKRVLAGSDLISNPKHATDKRGVRLRGLVARRKLEEVLMAVSHQLSRQIVTPARLSGKGNAGPSGIQAVSTTKIERPKDPERPYPFK